MTLFVFWLGLALLVGIVGKERKIGFGLAFFWAILLSPIIGLVIALLSDKKQTKLPYNPSSLNHQVRRTELKEDSLQNRTSSLSDSSNSKMTLKEWKEKNPHKNINDYYREVGR